MGKAQSLERAEHVTLTKGGSGWMVIWLKWYDDINAFDIHVTGDGRYAKAADAIPEARAMAEENALQLRLPDPHAPPAPSHGYNGAQFRAWRMQAGFSIRQIAESMLDGDINSLMAFESGTLRDNYPWLNACVQHRLMLYIRRINQMPGAVDRLKKSAKFGAQPKPKGGSK